MRTHYLQHVPFEGLGSIGPWLRAGGHETSCTRLFEAALFPEVSEVDLLIIMGGPMSVHDEKQYPWLVPEKQFIRQAIEQGASVLGICLGAQLIANAMGARVYQNPEKEIGWFPVQGRPSMDGAVFRLPSSVTAFHWHGETFDLPPGAVHLAESEACKHQAFQLGASVVGLQFHLEATPDSARALVANCREELREARHVQSEAAILSAPQENYAVVNRLMAEGLSRLTGTLHR